MSYLLSVGGIAAILYMAYVFMRRARVDAVLADLKRKDRSEEIREMERLIKEIEDAKARYNNSRREYDDAAGKFSESGVPGDGDQH